MSAWSAPLMGCLWGYDGSADSEQALSWAAREARSCGSILTICQAWAPGYPASASEVAAFDLARQCGERILAQGLRSARAIMGSGEVQPLLAGGQAASVLCEHSTSADMVVVSSRAMAASLAYGLARSARRSPRMRMGG
jgi:hypothetical protein